MKNYIVILSVLVNGLSAWGADYLSIPAVAKLQLNAPLKKMRRESFGFSENEKLPTFAGQLVLVDDVKNPQALNVIVQVRGQSSRDELDFPKLKVKLVKDTAQPKADVGFDSLRIGTHGFDKDSTDYTMLGRLASSAAIYREATAYDVLQVLNVTTLKYRRAKITYTDTDLKTQKPITKPALLLESDKAAAKRLGGEVIDDKMIAKQIAQTLIPIEELTKAIMAETLLGNSDFRIPMTQNEKDQKYVFVHNLTVVKLSETSATLIVGDFDLANAVTNYKELTPAPDSDLYPAGTTLNYMWMLKTLSDLKINVGAEIFNKVATDFIAHKEKVLSTINNANEDKVGKDVFKHTVMQFYEILEKQ